MELKEGMFVRTHSGTVGILGKRIGNSYRSEIINSSNQLFVEDNVRWDNVKNASLNLIDLIEVGDYVNGYNVSATYLEGTNYYIKLENEYTDGKRIYNKDIKSIVTKEQFEQMSYKVGE